MRHVIDEMPDRATVIEATPEQIVEWHIYLRPTMANEELDIVKAIAQRYDRLPASVREHYAAVLRRRYS